MVRGLLFAGGALGLTVVALPLGLVFGVGYCGVRLRQALRRRRQRAKQSVMFRQWFDLHGLQEPLQPTPPHETPDANVGSEPLEEAELALYKEPHIDLESTPDLELDCASESLSDVDPAALLYKAIWM